MARLLKSRQILASSSSPSYLRLLEFPSRHNTCQASHMSGQGGEWLFPANRDTMIYDAYDRRGTRKGILGITVNTAQPLQPHHINQTLTHICRQIPLLQVVLRPREDGLWFYKTPTQSYNVQLEEDDHDLGEICFNLGKAPFKPTDPVFWRAKVVPRGAQEPCPIPHIKASYPHQYDIAFLSHHALGDGLDAGLMTYALVENLRSVLAGLPIDDTPLGTFVNIGDLTKLKQEVMRTLLADTDRSEAVKRTLPPPGSKPLVLQIGSMPQKSERITKQVNRTIEKSVMAKFKQKAKEAGVSLATGIMAANNTAVVELAKSEGFNQESFSITHGLNVTIRHYLPKPPIHQMGPFSSIMTNTTILSKNVKEDFWNYAAQLHREVRSGIKSRLCLEQEAVMGMNQLELPPEECISQPKLWLHDYGLSYLGDFSAALESDNKYLQVTRVDSYNLMHDCFWTNLHQVLNFQGSTSYTICYDSHYLTDDTANRFIDKVVDIITEISDTPSINSKL